MADEIQVDYKQLEAIATRFAQQAEVATAILQRLQQTHEPLEQGGWIGRGADSFFHEMNGEVLPATARLIAALNQLNQTTGEIAETFRRAEGEASSSFRKE